MTTYLSPESFARELLHSLKIDVIPVPVEDICRMLDIECIYTDQIEADAIIAKKYGQTKIIINTNNPYGVRTRFSIAHELVRISAASGHSFRKHPDSVSELSGQHNGISGQ